MFLAVSVAFLIPLFAVFWLVSLAYAGYNPDFTPPSPWRWATGFIVPVLVATYGLHKKSLSQSGAGTALIVGFLLSISSIRFLFALLAFFIFASKATKFRSARKKKIEADFKEGGQRNWMQVICNGGPASILAVLYMLEVGSVDLPIDFENLYLASWYAIAVLASLSCCSGDTFASEIGTAVGTGEPFHVLTLHRIPRGTNGGISFIGTLSSLFGGLIVGLAFYLTVLVMVPHSDFWNAPPQWPILVYASLSGGLGSLIDSVLGATLQYSGKHTKLGYIVDHSGQNIERISGYEVLDNHSVNLLSSLMTGIIMPYICAHTWNFFS